MIKENLVLSSSAINKIPINQYIEDLSKFNWEKIKIEICAMPRNDLKSPPIVVLDDFSKPINPIIKSFKTPIESISISGQVEECSINITSLIDDNSLKWIEVNLQAPNKVSLDPILQKFNNLLRKSL